MGQHGSQNGTISDLQLPPAQSGLELSSQDTFPSPTRPGQLSGSPAQTADFVPGHLSQPNLPGQLCDSFRPRPPGPSSFRRGTF
jgi:hypothetical protein